MKSDSGEDTLQIEQTSETGPSMCTTLHQELFKSSSLRSGEEQPACIRIVKVNFTGFRWILNVFYKRCVLKVSTMFGVMTTGQMFGGRQVYEMFLCIIGICMYDRYTMHLLEITYAVSGRMVATPTKVILDWYLVFTDKKKHCVYC